MQVRKHKISLRKCSGGSAQLCTLEETLEGSLRDLKSTITTVNVNRKLGYLSSQKKIKFFHMHILSNAFCPFPNDRKRTNVFREEAIADHNVEEY